MSKKRFIDFKKELRREDRRVIEGNVKRGVKVLDKEVPGWFRKGSIALSRLNLEDTNDCVCGQLAAKAAIGTYEFCNDILGVPEYAITHGFDMPRLSESADDDYEIIAWAYLGLLWESAIKERRS